MMACMTQRLIIQQGVGTECLSGLPLRLNRTGLRLGKRTLRAVASDTKDDLLGTYLHGRNLLLHCEVLV